MINTIFKKITNTKMKRIWWVFTLTTFVILIIIGLLTYLLTKDKKLLSNIFFGFGTLSLSIILFAYIINKKSLGAEKKGIDISMDQEVIDSYFVVGAKDKDIKKVLKTRIIYLISYSIIFSFINMLIAYLLAI